MPVLAAGLADVGVRDPDPFEPRRLLQHLLDAGHVLPLHVGAVPQGAASILEPLRERIPDLLQLAEAQHAWTAARADPPLEPPAGVRVREDRGELALQLGDLP